jgi:hypothetical protein
MARFVSRNVAVIPPSRMATANSYVWPAYRLTTMSNIFRTLRASSFMADPSVETILIAGWHPFSPANTAVDQLPRPICVKKSR